MLVASLVLILIYKIDEMSALTQPSDELLQLPWMRFHKLLHLIVTLKVELSTIR